MSLSQSLSGSHSWLGQSRVMSRRKGLTNDLGENNCFLNVIIQSLWHLRSCRVLIATGDHALHHRFGGRVTKPSAMPTPPNANANAITATTEACLLCELEQIFILYQFAEEPVLDVDRVRLALGGMFSVGAMNDATETLEAILDALHWDTFNRMLTLRRGAEVLSMAELSQSSVEDASAIICEPQCIAHLLFQMNLMELQSCKNCGETKEPLMNTDFLYRVYAQELLSVASAARVASLEDVLRLEAQGGCIAEEHTPSCDACQNGKMAMSRWILKLPMVFAMGIIWNSEMVEKHEVIAWMELLSTQNARQGGKSSSNGSMHSGSHGKNKSKNDPVDKQSLELGRIFRLDGTPEAAGGAESAPPSEYTFRGMVCYYGRHYVGFFKSRSVENGISEERWFLFDDTRVKLVGQWADVRSRVERGVYQPTLLFYERKGIQQRTLEKTAAEIHQWWKESAEAKDKTDAQASGERETERKPYQSNGMAAAATPTANSAEPPSPPPPPPPPHVPTSSSLLPMSPIHSSSRTSPTNEATRSWLDEDLFLMHQSAQDTLSRLNGILSREVKAPTSTSNGSAGTASGVDDPATTACSVPPLDPWRSMTMPRSVRRREYSVHRLGEAEEDVDRDSIFRDVATNTAVSTGSGHATPVAASSTGRQPRPDSAQILATVLEATSVGDDGLDASTVTVPVVAFDVQLNASDGGLGLVLSEPTASDVVTSTNDIKHAFIVSGFEANGAGEKLAGEASGAIQLRDELVAINGHVLEEEPLVAVLEMLWTAPNPVQLTFHRLMPWTCPRCTLHNEVDARSCAACGHEGQRQRGPAKSAV